MTHKNTIARLRTALSLVALSAACAHGSITLNLEGGLLYDAFGDALPDGTLIIAVSAGVDDMFEQPTPGAFVVGDDRLIGSGGADQNVAGLGSFSLAFTTVELSGGLAAGQPFGIYWFPGYTNISQELTAGSSFGFFTHPSWTVPNDGDTGSFGLETIAIDGLVPDTMTIASYTVVPEPSTYALLFGGLALIGVWVRRRSAAR
jgi:hypothetical protein